MRRPRKSSLFPSTTLFRSTWTPARRFSLFRAPVPARSGADRKSTRLNSSHLGISYAVFCLKKKKEPTGGDECETTDASHLRAQQCGGTEGRRGARPVWRLCARDLLRGRPAIFFF